jgi:hypothetical protein
VQLSDSSVPTDLLARGWKFRRDLFQHLRSYEPYLFLRVLEWPVAKCLGVFPNFAVLYLHPVQHQLPTGLWE